MRLLLGPRRSLVRSYRSRSGDIELSLEDKTDLKRVAVGGGGTYKHNPRSPTGQWPHEAGSRVKAVAACDMGGHSREAAIARGQRPRPPARATARGP
ncbi:hypothetical protein BHE74_00033851 [Ensete ventricosum]|nr:hypothetical protein BHE74_00033851 [Ensete ventricosum]